MTMTEEELARTHLGLSSYDWKFRQVARKDPEFLARKTFHILDEGNPLLTYRLQSWPTFLDTAKLEELKRVSLGVSRVLRNIPERAFANDPVRISEFYGLNDPDLAELLMSPPNGVLGAVSRGDLIDTQGGFKCIEFNMGANLGGWETGVLAEMHLSIPAISTFLREQGLSVSYTDTVRVLYQHVLEEVSRYGIPCRGEVNIAFSTYSESPLGRGPIFEAYLNREYQAVLAQIAPGLSGRVVRANDEDFRARDGAVYWGATQIHGIVEVDSGNTLPEVYQAFKAKEVLLYNGPNNFIMTSKRNIALLSEHRNDEAWSAEDRKIIQDHIPWTTLLLPRYVDYEGERVFLPELLLSHRERFVIKDSLSAGGKGVRLGKFTPAARWEEIIEKALEEGDWLVQEHLECIPYLYQNGEFGCSPHNVIWGPFIFGPLYAGVILRMQPMADDGAVNLSLTATQGVVFELGR
jgi:hypothetical protein